MSFPRYPAYKDSGDYSLRHVPEHWFIGQVKHVCRFFTGWTPPTGDASSYVGDNYWANISDLGPKWLTETNKQISDAAVAKSDIRVSRAGDLLFSFKLSIGQVSFAGIDLYTNEAIATFPPSDRLNLRYGYYALPFFLVRNASDNIYGAKLLNQELMKSARIVLPPLREQEQLADFLEIETAKIDALVAEQEQLITLLKEKRQAVISHAVTKGLDPSVPMKDSGVEWLGEVPSHWEVTHLKRRCALVTDGAHISPETEGGVHLFVSTKDISDDGIDFDGALRTSPASYEYMVKTGCQPASGDVLFSKDGTIGRTVVVNGATEFVIASSLIIIRPIPDQLNSDFLNALCQSWVVSQQVDGFVKGAGLPRLSIQNLLKVVGVFPPIDEQVQIANYLSDLDMRSRTLALEAERTVALLKERRSALISAAVTGQIDVRGLVTAKEAA